MKKIWNHITYKDKPDFAAVMMEFMEQNEKDGLNRTEAAIKSFSDTDKMAKEYYDSVLRTQLKVYYAALTVFVIIPLCVLSFIKYGPIV